MNDRYYVFKQGLKRGPFTLVDLLDEIENGLVEYHDLCLRIGSTTCEKVRDALDWDDQHLLPTPASADPDDSDSRQEGPA